MEKIGGDDMIINKLKTDRLKGIASAHKGSREEFFGNNKKPEVKLKTLLQIFIQSLDDFTLKILIVAAIVSIVVEMLTSKHPETAWIEGVAIIVAVLLSSGITTINDYQK